MTITKNNSITCISNDRLRFLYITNYLAPGTSYSNLLKAYGIKEVKEFFWTNTSSVLTNWTKRNSHPTVLSTAISNKKNISEEDYQFCVDIWQKQNMTCLRNFLEWYNNQDVGPFVQAVRKLLVFYFERNIDISKVAMSVPGIAWTMLFRASARAQETFALYGKTETD